MKLTAEAIDSIIKESREYESVHPGRAVGPDFGEFSEALADSKEFEATCLIAPLTVSIGMPKMQEALKSADGLSVEEKSRALAAASPIRRDLLEAMYWGYLAGKREVEIEYLKQMSK